MLIFLVILSLYLFESLRCEIMVMTINHKLGRLTNKRLSNWYCLIWPYLYVWVSYRKTKWWKKLAAFLNYNKPT